VTVYQPIAKTLYSNAASGDGTTLTVTGSSAKTINLREVADVVLSVVITGSPAGSTPTLVVQLDCQDANGNWLPQVVKTASLNAAGTTVVYGGTNTSNVVLTDTGRITWTIGGTSSPSFSAAISLIGR
jgi:hypothetical protein